MIEITRKEALTIVKALSKIEGTLINMGADSSIVDLLDDPTQLLSDKILKSDCDENELAFALRESFDSDFNLEEAFNDGK